MVKKISIIGSGSVGSMLAFHILSGLDIKDLVLVDISGSLAKGIALDLEDTRGFLKFNTHVLGTSNINHIENSDIVVITCGIPRKEGMTRYDLFKTNSKIVIEVTRKIKRLAPTSLIVVVTNPLDASFLTISTTVALDTFIFSAILVILVDFFEIIVSS